MMMGYQLNVMTQALYVEDKANLLNGIYMVRTYLEFQDGSQSIAIIPQNLTSKPLNLPTNRVIAWITAANEVPEVKPMPELLKKLKQQDPEAAPQKLTIEGRQELLMQLLQEEGGLHQLKTWLEVALKFERLLIEYHVFSLDKNKIGLQMQQSMWLSY